jgi:hypothetical protein
MRRGELADGCRPACAAPECLGDGVGIFDRREFVGGDKADPKLVDSSNALFVQNLLDGALHGGGKLVERNARSHVGFLLDLSQFEQVFKQQHAQGSTKVPSVASRHERLRMTR